MEIRTETYDIEKKINLYSLLLGLAIMGFSFITYLLKGTILVGKFSPENSYIIGAACVGGTLFVVSYNYRVLSQKFIKTRGDIVTGLILIFILPFIVRQDSEVIFLLTFIFLFFFLRTIVITIRAGYRKIRENNIKEESN